MTPVRSWNDLLVGAMLIAVALAALALSRNLALGTATSMGPAYVPRLICIIQIAIGVAIMARGWIVAGERPERWLARPLLWVPASVAFFALTIERLGLVVAVLGLVALSTLACRRTRLVEAGLLAVFMAALSVLLFVVGLGQPMRVLPSALTP